MPCPRRSRKKRNTRNRFPGCERERRTSVTTPPQCVRRTSWSRSHRHSARYSARSFRISGKGRRFDESACAGNKKTLRMKGHTPLIAQGREPHRGGCRTLPASAGCGVLQRAISLGTARDALQLSVDRRGQRVNYSFLYDHVNAGFQQNLHHVAETSARQRVRH